MGYGYSEYDAAMNAHDDRVYCERAAIVSKRIAGINARRERRGKPPLSRDTADALRDLLHDRDSVRDEARVQALRQRSGNEDAD